MKCQSDGILNYEQYKDALLDLKTTFEFQEGTKALKLNNYPAKYLNKLRQSDGKVKDTLGKVMQMLGECMRVVGGVDGDNNMNNQQGEEEQKENNNVLVHNNAINNDVVVAVKEYSDYEIDRPDTLLADIDKNLKLIGYFKCDLKQFNYMLLSDIASGKYELKRTQFDIDFDFRSGFKTIQTSTGRIFLIGGWDGQ